MPEMAPTEIMALARILGELDYYQLLHLKPGANERELRAAYHATSRAFHPDANRHLDAPLREAVASISKRVTEAYSVLRHPRRRKAYDHRLEAGEGNRMQLAEAEAEGGRRLTEERQGRTAQGRQYFKLAAADIKRGDYQAAARNLATALTFEPGNEGFKQQLSEVREKLRRR